MFSMKMPYPVVGSLTRIWVTVPTSFSVAVPVHLAVGTAMLHPDRDAQVDIDESSKKETAKDILHLLFDYFLVVCPVENFVYICFAG